MSFLREAFSEGGQASSSRLMMAFHALAGATWVSYHIYAAPTHPLPDAVTLSGVTAFVVAPYAINAMKGAAQSFAPKP